MDLNPYQSPTASCDATTAERFADFPSVDGKCLVVASGTVLPPVCVKTNQRLSEKDLVCKRFEWCTPWVALLVLLSPLLLILAYFLVRRKCSLTYGLHPQIRKKYRKRILLKIVAAIVLLLAIVLSASVDAAAVAMLFVFLFLVSLVWLFVGNSPLSVVKYRKKMFWIKGFSDEFLATFEPVVLGEPIAAPADQKLWF